MTDPDLNRPITGRHWDAVASSASPEHGSGAFDLPPPSGKSSASSADPEVEGLDKMSEEDFKKRLTSFTKQMMFVSGETAEPSAETTGMIEELVKQQVIEMVGYYCAKVSLCFGTYSYEA